MGGLSSDMLQLPLMDQSADFPNINIRNADSRSIVNCFGHCYQTQPHTLVSDPFLNLYHVKSLSIVYEAKKRIVTPQE